jgi:hypothetical protein
MRKYYQTIGLKIMILVLVFTISIFFSANSGFSEMRITTHNGQILKVPVNSNDIKIIEFTQGEEALSIEGIWGSSIGFQYKISQSGNNFTWNVMKPLREQGRGTISGNNINASWSGDNGSGSANGRIMGVDSLNRASRIEWSNGVVFSR